MSRAVPDTLAEGDWSFLDFASERQRACFGTDTDVFYPASYSAKTTRQARAICGRCPVKVQCLEFVLASHADADEGVWAATTPAQRQTMRRPLPPEPALCKRDHPMTPENTLIETNGKPRCRACKTLGSRESNARALARKQAERRSA